MSFSSVGLGSGLDVTSMVSQLVELEKRPLNLMQKQAANLNARVSAFSQLKSAISNLQDQVSKLTSADTWNAKSATSTKSEFVSASVTSAATPTSMNVNVQALAKGQVLASSTVQASGYTHATGSLQIYLGRVVPGPTDTDPSTFEDTSVEGITVEMDGKTLTQIASEINAKNAGVSATVLRDSSGERLTFQSTGTGAQSAFRIEGSGEGAAYNFSPANALSNPLVTSSQIASDAKISVNGVVMFSSTNTFTDIADGVNLTISKVMEADDSAVITVKNDSSVGKNALKNLVESYNSFSTSISTMTAYNPDSKEAGTLQGDSTALSLQNALRRILTGAAGSGVSDFTSLSEIGLEFQKDGKLKINDSKLDSALSKTHSMVDLWSADPEGTEKDGMAIRLKSFTEGLLSGDGLFATKDESLKNQIKRNTADQERVTARVTSYEKSLLAKYTALDTKMASLTALDAYISQQVSSWNQSSRS